jgi:outer membrane protein assembly factor BamB
VTFEAVVGATYAIAISGKGPEGLVTFSLVSVPMNDAFAQAINLSGPSVVIEGNTASATEQAGEPKPRNSRGTAIGIGHSLWYKWTAPATRNYQVSAFEKTTDPLVSIYTGTALNSLVEVASDDDSGPFLDSLVRFAATAGVTYSIRVDTSRGSGGRFRLSIADAAWQYPTDSALYTSSAVAPDGTLYLADGLGFIHAVGSNGVRKWRSSAVAGYALGGSITVAPDGTLHAADDFGVFYALSPANGALKWFFETDGIIWAAPALAADGTLYVKSDDGLLYALTAAGTKKWSFPIPGDTYSAPVVAPDGTVYIASGGNTALYAINPDGTEKWRAPLGATCYASPALGADGTIYLGNYDGRFFAFRPDGTERWHIDTGSPLSCSPVLDARGVVYFGSYNRKLYAIDAASGSDGLGIRDGRHHSCNVTGPRRRRHPLHWQR